MPREYQKTHTRRVVVLIVCCVVVVAALLLRAFQFQIVGGDAFLAQAQHSTSASYPVPAARGQIVDRNGTPMTVNRACFNVEFDYTLLPKASKTSTRLDDDAVNAMIAKLIDVFEGLGETWLDELPIETAPPYDFRPDATASEISRLKKKMGDLGREMAGYASAQDCLYWLELSFGIHTADGADGSADTPAYDAATARKIAGVRYEMLLKDFSSVNTRFTFAEDVSPTSVAWLQERIDEFPGVAIGETATRDYVAGDVASHILGTVGPIYEGEFDYYKQQEGKNYQMSDTVGRSGIEKAFESDLRGTNGAVTAYLDAQNRVVRREETQAPQAGHTVQLTLDYGLQKEVQQIFSDYIDDYNARKVQKEVNGTKYTAHAEAGAVVMLDVKTGEVLALVSYPYYDINDYVNHYNELLNREGSPLNNRALNGLYRPGSTFKPVVGAGAVADGLQDPETTITCTYRYTYWPDTNFRCLMDRHTIGSKIDLVHALDYSCNIYFYDSGRRLGIDRMDYYAHKFGLGVDTGLEIPSAVGHISAGSDPNWEEGNVAQAAIGQMNTSVTPLQMACEAMTLANQGVRYETHLVKNILSYDGSEVLKKTEPKVASSFKMEDDLYAALKEGMIRVGKNIHGAYSLDGLGYDVAVKTGTPQVSATKTNNCCIAYAPADDPQVAIAVMVEDGNATNQILRRLLIAWETYKNGGVLPERFQPLPESASSAPAGRPPASSELVERASGISSLPLSAPSSAPERALPDPEGPPESAETTTSGE